MRESPTVLIVEDEPLIQFYACELAESAGFLTLTASTADEALRELDGPVDVDILLTDVQMPGTMDGLALAERVHDRWPEIDIVVASGNITKIEAAVRCDAPARFLPKPFTADEFLMALGARGEGSSSRRSAE